MQSHAGRSTTTDQHAYLYHSAQGPTAFCVILARDKYQHICVIWNRRLTTFLCHLARASHPLFYLLNRHASLFTGTQSTSSTEFPQPIVET